MSYDIFRRTTWGVSEQYKSIYAKDGVAAIDRPFSPSSSRLLLQ